MAGLLGLVTIVAASYGPSGLSVFVGVLFSVLFGYGWPH